MAKVGKKAGTCGNCGLEVRPDTQFCYNCGKSVAVATAEPGSEAKKSLEDLEKALAAEFPAVSESRSKLESAAAERRRARKGLRKPVVVVWEPIPAGGNRLYYLLALLIFVIVAGLVFFTVFVR